MYRATRRPAAKRPLQGSSRSGARRWRVPLLRASGLRRVAAAASLALVLALPAVAHAKGRIFFEDTIPRGGSSSVTITTHGPASFRVVLRVPTQGRAKLFLTGKNAPKGGPLIDTKTYACEGAAGSFYCRAAYEPLPKGSYTWRIAWTGRRAAHVELTVRW